MNTISNGIKKLDVLGIKPMLLFDKKREYTTVFGGCVSFSFLVLSLCSFTFFLFKLIDAETTTLSFSSNLVEIGSLPSNLPSTLEFGLQLNPSLQSDFEADRVEISASLGSSTIQLESCPTNAFNRADGSSKYLCLGGETLSLVSVQLQGNLSLKVTQLNSPSGPYEATFLFTNNQIFPSDYKNPTESGVFSTSVSFSQTVAKHLKIDYKLVEIQTDSGWIFQSEESDFYFTVQQATQTTVVSNSPMTLEIGFPGTKETIIRRYYKLQDFVAQLGGFIKFLYVIGKILVYPVNEAFYYHALISNEKSKTASKPAKINLNDCSKTEMNKEECQNSRSFRELKKLRQVSLLRVIVSNFCLFSCFNNDSAAHYRKVRETIEGKLDISNFLMMLKHVTSKLHKSALKNNLV